MKACLVVGPSSPNKTGESPKKSQQQMAKHANNSNFINMVRFTFLLSLADAKLESSVGVESIGRGGLAFRGETIELYR